jgi:chromosome segregation ATPase
MKRALMLVLFCGAMVSLALAQQPASTEVPAAPPPPESAASGPVDATPTESSETTTPGTLDKTPPVVADTHEARELPLDSETFDVRVHRRVTEYNQRHHQRELRMSSYDKVSVGDPGLERFADPRKVQVELSDELDRERTSEELCADYAEQAHDAQSKAQALQEFMAKRRETLDELNKSNGPSQRQDLEMALANLARQPLSPETLAAMREIDRRLSETDRNEKDLPARLSQNQQETADAAEELAKLQALQQAYEKEAKAFTADALSARQNRLRLASKLEYFIVRAQAEDTLEQGRKALQTVEHLSASPEVESLLRGPGSTSRSQADLEQMRDCIQKSGDVKACRQAIHKE